MPDRDTLKHELKLLNELAPLVTARQEIAVKRINDPQKKVLAARSFFTNLVYIFGQVRSAYEKEVSSSRQTREGHAAFLFSPEQYLTGPIATATFRYFIDYLDHHVVEPFIIGRVGRQRFQEELPNTSFQYVDFKDIQDGSKDTLPKLIQELLRYKTITFVFGQYANLIQQRPTHVTIGDTTGQSETDGTVHKFLFEPSIESIVSLFDRNIIALLFTQAEAENTLAQLGSQITSMEKADTAIKKQRKILLRLGVEEKHRVVNKQQRDRLAGLQLWFNH